jgi:sulfatase modifying factor 1
MSVLWDLIQVPPKMSQRPVECVSSEDAQRYCQAVGMRLPTEAEWEYAARAGSTAARYGELDEIAWYDKNSRMETHDIKGKQPNAWGLYDTLGNVDEWVADRWDETYYERSEVRDPGGPTEGYLRLTRGGSALNSSLSVSASRRFWREPIVPYDDVGFRCVGELS